MKKVVVPKNCLFLLDNLGVGGSERKTIVAANKLAESGYRVHLAFLNLNQDISSTINSSIGIVNLSRVGKLDRNVIRNLREYIQKNKIEVLWSVNLYPMFYAYLSTLGKTGVRVIGSSNVSRFRNTYEKLKMLIYVPIIWQLDAFIFGSTRQMKEWQRIYPIGKARCFTIHNGVDTDKFSLKQYGLAKTTARQQMSLPENGLVIAMVAQFRVEKAHADLIKAVKNILDTGIDVNILFVGAGNTQDDVRGLVVKLGMSDRVIFAGLMHDVRPALVAADVFALTSRAVETFSNAALEAMSMEVPVVLSDLGGAGEMVDKGINGLLYPPGDINKLTECITGMLDDVSRREMGENARRVIEKRFSSEIMAKRYADVIDGFFDNSG